MAKAIQKSDNKEDLCFRIKNQQIYASDNDNKLRGGPLPKSDDFHLVVGWIGSVIHKA